MGGGIRGDGPGNRTRDNNRTITSYDSTSKPRVFISFHIADEAQVNLLRSQAKDPRYNIEFTDYSVKEPFDEKWKTNCTERIKQSTIVVVMIGEDTHTREAVDWEIEKAYELGKPVIGVRIHKDKNHRIPKPLLDHKAPITNWDLDRLQTVIDRVRA